MGMWGTETGSWRQCSGERGALSGRGGAVGIKDGTGVGLSETGQWVMWSPRIRNGSVSITWVRGPGIRYDVNGRWVCETQRP